MFRYENSLSMRGTGVTSPPSGRGHSLRSVLASAGAFLVTAVIAFGFSGEAAQGAKAPVVTTSVVPKPVERAEAAIPDFDLVDLRNTKTVNLASLRTPGRAMLIWLWAPN